MSMWAFRRYMNEEKLTSNIFSNLLLLLSLMFTVRKLRFFYCCCVLSLFYCFYCLIVASRLRTSWVCFKTKNWPQDVKSSEWYLWYQNLTISIMWIMCSCEKVCYNLSICARDTPGTIPNIDTHVSIRRTISFTPFTTYTHINYYHQ